jgi:hypothetical protein
VLINPYLIEPRPPANISVVAGEALTISAKTYGTIPQYYRWRRTLPPAQGGGSSTMSNTVFNANTAFITYPSANTNLAGTWSVAMTNEYTGATFTSLSNVAVVTILADSDSDGIPDNWEIANGLNHTNSTDATIDSDGDTMINRHEYIAGTDPQDEDSYLRIDALPGSGATLTFQAVSNRTYTIVYSDIVSLPVASWTKLADFVAAAANRTEIINDPGFTTNRFYKLITPRQP